MISLNTAKDLVAELDGARTTLEYYLDPTLQDFIEFLPERGNSWTPEKFTKAEDYSFTEIENSHFIFESEEWYECGDYTKDTIELPFAFVEDPEAFKAKERAEIAEKAKKFTETQRAAAEARVTSLEAQLEAARKTAGLRAS